VALYASEAPPVLVPSETVSYKAVWRRSSKAQMSGSASWYASRVQDLEGTKFDGLVKYDAKHPGWFMGRGRGFRTFETWILSETDVALSLGSGGDDGHSIFVDGAFVEGDGFGKNVCPDLVLKAGVPRRLVLTSNESGGGWHVNCKARIGETGDRVPLEDLPGITLHSEMPTVVTQPIPLRAPSLVLYYSFDDDEGEVVTDRSGNGNHGAVYGPAQVAVDGGGSAYAFDGVSDYIDCGGGSSLQITGSLTYSAWVKLDGARSQSGIVIGRRKWDDAYRIASHLSIVKDTGVPQMGICSGAWENGQTLMASNSVVADGRWHMVSAVYNAGTSMRLYVDGALSAERSGNVFAALNSRQLPVYVGRESASRFHFAGSIDEVRIYNGALSSKTIDQLYKKTRPAEVAPTQRELARHL
jgi:hypothetical protein